MPVETTEEMIAEAWGAWKSRHKGSIGPGPGFVEALRAMLAASPDPTQDEALVERGARAICVAVHEGSDFGMTGEDIWRDHPRVRADYRKMFLAAIRAMGEKP